jgi:lipid A 4'-phosphatase
MGRVAAAYGVALIAAAAIFLLFPSIDLWASGAFYRAGTGFFLAQSWPVRAIYAGIPFVTDAIVLGVPALYLVSVWRRRATWRIDGRAAAFLLLALALGPGLLVNTLLKDHWGRARPTQVVEFGGTQHFTPAPLPADQCGRNCSFPAGHPAIGFYLVSFAFLVAAPRRRRIAAAAAVAAGALIGLARIAQGGHFLSDVVFSGLLVCGTSWLLYHAVLGNDRLARRSPLAPPRWLAPAAAGLAIGLAASIALLDRPLARFFHGSDERLRNAFQFITQFGLGKGYLVIAAALFVGLRTAAWVTRNRQESERLSLNAYRALYVFVAVALPGLLVDILKVVFGRARPKLLFIDGSYGFAWGAWQSDHWSFPSGHATTIVALATALYLLWPRGLPLYVLAALLVAASRVVIDAHYLSDVIAGAAIGGGTAWAMWLAFPRLGVSLVRAEAQPTGLPGPPVRSLER